MICPNCNYEETKAKYREKPKSPVEWKDESPVEWNDGEFWTFNITKKEYGGKYRIPTAICPKCGIMFQYERKF